MIQLRLPGSNYSCMTQRKNKKIPYERKHICMFKYLSEFRAYGYKLGICDGCPVATTL